MERLAQILDDLDDVFGTIGLAGERIRALVFLLLSVMISLILQAAAILLALRHPPLALATAVLMFTILLYRTVTSLHASQPVSGPAGSLQP